jgi:hypothetical protein
MLSTPTLLGSIDGAPTCRTTAYQAKALRLQPGIIPLVGGPDHTNNNALNAESASKHRWFRDNPLLQKLQYSVHAFLCSLLRRPGMTMTVGARSC